MINFRLSTLLLLAAQALSGIHAASAASHAPMFPERVEAQRAIERIYHGHQIGSGLPFDRAVPDDLLERKVLKYLRQRTALEAIWGTRVTPRMLAAEEDRIARRTRFPERLRAIEAALGGDVTLFRECFVLPVLVDRLSRSFFSWDRSIHKDARRAAEGLRAELATRALDPRLEHPRRAVALVTNSKDPAGPRTERRDPAGSVTLRMSDAEFSAWWAARPRLPGVAGSVEEAPDAFSVQVILEEREGEALVATYTVPKIRWDEWWEATAPALDPWEGESAVIEEPFAAVPMHLESSGACPEEDVWQNGSLDDLIDPRQGHSAVWTGSELLVWGGYNGRYLRSGARYDPLTDQWAPLATAAAPAPRY